MKKLFVLLLSLTMFVFTTYAQTGIPLYSIESTSNRIVDKNEMKDKLIGEDIEYSSFYSSLDVKVGNVIYSVKVAQDSTTDPAYGFNAILVYHDSDKILELKDFDEWTYTYSGECTYDYSQYTDNRYFIPLNLNATTKALCFVGWPYGGDLPYLTIIALTEKDAKVVFHKQLGLRDITERDGEYSIKTQTILGECDSSGILCTAPAYGEIYSKDGILYVKQ